MPKASSVECKSGGDDDTTSGNELEDKGSAKESETKLPVGLDDTGQPSERLHEDEDELT
jgi:hypothetical protein